MGLFLKQKIRKNFDGKSLIPDIVFVIKEFLNNKVRAGIVNHLRSVGSIGGTLASRIKASSPEFKIDVLTEAGLLANAIEMIDFSDTNLTTIKISSKKTKVFIEIDFEKMESFLSTISAEITTRANAAKTVFINFPDMWRFYLTKKGRSSGQNPKNYTFDSSDRFKSKSMYGVGIMIKTTGKSSSVSVKGKDLFSFYVEKMIIKNSDFYKQIETVVVNGEAMEKAALQTFQNVFDSLKF